VSRGSAHERFTVDVVVPAGGMRISGAGVPTASMNARKSSRALTSSILARRHPTREDQWQLLKAAWAIVVREHMT
jgi:hypothetical protein